MRILLKTILILFVISGGVIYSADKASQEKQAADKSLFGIKINGYNIKPNSGSIQFRKNGIKSSEFKDLKLKERLVFPTLLGDEVTLFFMQGRGAIQEKIKVQQGILCEICKPEGQIQNVFKVSNGTAHVKLVPRCKEGFEPGEFTCIKKVPLVM